MKRGVLAIVFLALVGVGYVSWSGEKEKKAKQVMDKIAETKSTGAKADGEKKVVDKITKTDAEWKQQLTAEQYYVTREKGTERAFTGALWNNHKSGTYKCVCCDLPLFESSTKFDSGTGWPSFWQPTEKAHVTEVEDRSWFSVRTEATCTRCGSHLGHVFDDGPKPTGLRYCMNSAALKFEEKPDAKAEKTHSPKSE